MEEFESEELEIDLAQSSGIITLNIFYCKIQPLAYEKSKTFKSTNNVRGNPKSDFGLSRAT